MTRNRLMAYFARAAGVALLAGTLSSCGLFRDGSPPNLSVALTETESGYEVTATARDSDSGIKSIEVFSVVDEEATTVSVETFAREDDDYPREAVVAATVPLGAEQVVVQAHNGFGVVGEWLRDVTPAAALPEAWAPAVLYLTPRVTAPDGMLLLVFDAGTADESLALSVRVQGELVAAANVTQLEDPRQWQMSVSANSFGFDLAAEDELLVNVTLTFGELTRSLTQTVLVELDAMAASF